MEIPLTSTGLHIKYALDTGGTGHECRQNPTGVHDGVKRVMRGMLPDSVDKLIRFCKKPKLESLDYTYDDVEIW
jgi:hypothetical protein